MIWYKSNRKNIRELLTKHGTPLVYQRIKNGIICDWFNERKKLFISNIFDPLGRDTISIQWLSEHRKPVELNFKSSNIYRISRNYIAMFGEVFDTSVHKERFVIFLCQGKLYKGKFRDYQSSNIYSQDANMVENISSDNFILLKMALEAPYNSDKTLQNLLDALGPCHYIFVNRTHKFLYYIGVHLCKNTLKVSKLTLTFTHKGELIGKTFITPKCDCMNFLQDKSKCFKRNGRETLILDECINFSLN